MVLVYYIPSHPKTSLTRCHRWRVFTRVFRGGALCQYSCCLTCDVFIKLKKLVQIHDPRCFHNATVLVNLNIRRTKRKNNLNNFSDQFFPKMRNKYVVKHLRKYKFSWSAKYPTREEESEQINVMSPTFMGFNVVNKFMLFDSQPCRVD